MDAERHREVEKLFELRATLEQYYEDNADEIAKIDEQLELLGVEEITYEEVPSAMFSGASPRITPAPRQNVKYLSERIVTVYNGEQYEIQILTSVPENKDSELRPTIQFSVDTESMKEADNIRFCTTMATGIIGYYSNISSGGLVNCVATSLTNVFTLYDLFGAYEDAVSPTTVVYGVECSGMVSLSIHERNVFIKNYGSPDDGYQIKACISNRVSYNAKILQEGELIVGGVSQPDIDVFEYKGTYYSKYYGSDDLDSDGILDISNDQADLIWYTAKNFWNYRKYGKSDFLVDHRIKRLSFDWAGGKTVTYGIPYFAYSYLY